jgi:predicted HNH restriction endonuclease
MKFSYSVAHEKSEVMKMVMVINGIKISTYSLNKAELEETEIPKGSFVAKNLRNSDEYYIIDNKHRELVSGLYQIL